MKSITTISKGGNLLNCLGILIPIGGTAFCQEAPVYAEQFQNLQKSVDQILNEVSIGIPEKGDQQLLEERLFALQKVTHRLQEGAAEADLAARKRGAGVNKQLRLVEQGCMAIDSVLRALGNYLDTDDRFFLSLAIEGKQTASSIRKVLMK